MKDYIKTEHHHFNVTLGIKAMLFWMLNIFIPENSMALKDLLE